MSVCYDQIHYHFFYLLLLLLLHEYLIDISETRNANSRECTPNEYRIEWKCFPYVLRSHSVHFNVHIYVYTNLVCTDVSRLNIEQEWNVSGSWRNIFFFITEHGIHTALIYGTDIQLYIPIPIYIAMVSLDIYLWFLCRVMWEVYI